MCYPSIMQSFVYECIDFFIANKDTVLNFIGSMSSNIVPKGICIIYVISIIYILKIVIANCSKI